MRAFVFFELFLGPPVGGEYLSRAPPGRRHLSSARPETEEPIQARTEEPIQARIKREFENVDWGSPRLQHAVALIRAYKRKKDGEDQ